MRQSHTMPHWSAIACWRVLCFDCGVLRRPVAGNHGSLILYYARITDIAVGVCVVLLFDLVMPWCALRVTMILPRPPRHLRPAQHQRQRRWRAKSYGLHSTVDRDAGMKACLSGSKRLVVQRLILSLQRTAFRAELTNVLSLRSPGMLGQTPWRGWARYSGRGRS